MVDDIISPLMTGRQAAKYLSIGKSTLYYWAKQGQIPYTIVGKSMRFRRDELDKTFRGIKE